MSKNLTVVSRLFPVFEAIITVQLEENIRSRGPMKSYKSMQMNTERFKLHEYAIKTIREFDIRAVIGSILTPLYKIAPESYICVSVQ